MFRAANEDPSASLGDVWTLMLDTKELYDAEKNRCKATFESVKWVSPTMADVSLECPACESSLIEQKNPRNTDQEEVVGKCNNCKEEISYQDLIVFKIDQKLGFDTYINITDGGESGPIHECPDCNNASFLDFEEQCAVCGAEYSRVSCSLCDEVMDWDWIFYGDSSDLCSYHSHTMSKDD